MSDMLNEVNYLPELISLKIPSLDEAIKDIFDHRTILSIKEIVITGSGDSYFAGIGARHFFQRICHIQTRALQSMEASRYDLLDCKSAFPLNPFVIAISVSGMVRRTVEAAKIARSQGALTLAIVGHGDSDLSRSTDKAIDCDLPPLPRSPGVASFRLSLLAMYLLGIHFAEVKRKITRLEGQSLRDGLKRTADQIRVTIDNTEDHARRLVDTLKNEKYFVFIGDGPNYSSALFSAAKIIEATGLVGASQNTEEWSHLQYFETAFQRIPTFVITSKNRGYNRAVELIPQMKRIGRNIIAISPHECTEINVGADLHLPVAAGVSDLFAPMVYPIGVELFSALLSEHLDTAYYREDLETHPKGGNSIRTSELLSKEQLESYE